jgi:raffinose/stachyose/melibiose transport system substrate-binding protein
MANLCRATLSWVVFIGALSSVLFAGCSEGPNGGANVAVELRVFDRITSVRGADYSQWLAATFNQRNKGKVHISWSATEDETYKPKINVVLRSRSAPDIFFTWEGGWARYMIESGYAAPLDRYYQTYGWGRELNRAGVSLARLDGHLYFVPTRMAASLVWYRPDIFERYGQSVPHTWEEMLATARLLKSNGITPFLLGNQKRWPAQFMWTALFVNKYGLEISNQLFHHQIPWTDPKVVDIFALMKQLSDDGLFEKGANALDVTPAVTLFASGKAAMWYQGSFLLTRFLDDQGRPLFPFDFFEFPRIGEQSPTASVFVEDGLMINRHSLHPDQAAAFLDWVLSTEAQTRQLQLGMPFPANVNVDLDKLPPVLQKSGRLIAEHSEATFMHIDHALPPAISNTFLDCLQAVLVGAMSPRQAGELMQKAAKTVEESS